MISVMVTCIYILIFDRSQGVLNFGVGMGEQHKRQKMQLVSSKQIGTGTKIGDWLIFKTKMRLPVLDFLADFQVW